MTPGGIRATLPPLSGLTLDEVGDIGIAAIRQVIGDPSLKIEFRLDFDRDEKPEYSFRLHLPTPEAWRDASDRIFQITEAVMADLARRGDDSFPFVWLLSDGSWTFGRDAAAE